jgi:hypothetical protein
MKKASIRYNFINYRVHTILVVLILFTSLNKINGQNGNITINNSNTSKGIWTTSGSVKTFNPNEDGANVNITDIHNNLENYNVIISTACPDCKELGNITVSSAITKDVLARVLYINAKNNVTISNTINLSSNSVIVNTKSTSLEINSTDGDIIITSNGTINNSRVAIENGLIGGDLKLIALKGSVKINGLITTSTVTSKKNCIGGNVIIYGYSGVTINNNITTTSNTSGSLNIKVDNPNFSISPDSTNLGQVGGAFNVASFEKSGVGIFQLNGNGSNQWTGNTNITGSILLAATNALPSNSNIIFNGGTIYTNGYTNTFKSIKVLDNSYINFDASKYGTITFNSFDYTNSTPNKYLIIKDWQGFSDKLALDKFGAMVATSNNFVTTNGSLQSVTSPNGLTQYGQILKNSFTGGLKGKLLFPKSISGKDLDPTVGKIRFYNSMDNTTYNSIQISSDPSTYEIIPNAIVIP